MAFVSLITAIHYEMEAVGYSIAGATTDGTTAARPRRPRAASPNFSVYTNVLWGSCIVNTVPRNQSSGYLFR